MKILVAVAQMTSTANKDSNLNKSEHLIKNAAKLGVKFLSLPENFAFLGDDAVKAAEDIDGESIPRLKKCAKKYGIWLSLGGFQEKIPGLKDKIYNSHIIINDHGEVVAKYHKIHLFSANISDNIYDETSSVLPGDKAICLITPFFTLGLSICYDIRFSSLYSILRDNGAEVLLVPAAFTEVTGKSHWEVLLRARAIETQCYVMAAAQIGNHNGNRKTHGHAMIVDPWGCVVAQCGEASDLAMAEIDMAFLNNVRTKMPVWEHRRTFYYDS
jgi:deaminated glutathione amidase